MKFWDTSALVALPAGQHPESGLDALVKGDTGVVLWWGTRVEMVSAACRLRRESRIDEETFAQLLTAFDELCKQADEIEPSEGLRQAAVRLVRVHNLTAADALQLAAALAWADGSSEAAGFVSLDRRLRKAAAAEGFRVLPA